MMAARKGSYYGVFFWLSVAAFAVPIFVAVYAFKATPGVYSKPASHPDASGVDNGLWDYLLKTYVENGLVDYEGMKRDYLLQTYVEQLGAADPGKLSTELERLALLINGYNAFVVAAVINHNITTSVMDYKGPDGAGFFDEKEHIFAGQTVSLNYIESTLIRPVYREPRVHMALVCAARSCPAIRREAYVGERLDAQLEDQAVLFANNPKYVFYDEAAKTLHLSPILKWYGADFDASGGYLAFLLKRAQAASLRSGIQAAAAGAAKVVFNEYDWRLNRQGGAPGVSTGGGMEFGSGSIPNE